MVIEKYLKHFVISSFVILYLWVSVVSTIHSIDFFSLSNNRGLAISLAIAFELGSAASLASLVILDKTNKVLVWTLFIVLVLIQSMSNMYYGYTHLHDYKEWSEMFGLNEDEVIFQKRVISIISGAILPLVALGFIKSLVDYIRPEDIKEIVIEPKIEEIKEEIPIIEEKVVDNNSEIIRPVVKWPNASRGK